MSDLIATGISEYASGALDTATTLINRVSPHDAKHVNGVAGAAIQIENVLGPASTLKGSHPDLATRLAVAVNADGTLNLGDPGATVLPVVNGGTGLSTLTAERVLGGNGVDPIVFLRGLAYEGPSAVGSGSTRSHEGSVTISGNQSLSGIHFYTNFTLDAGVTIDIPTGGNRVVIVATGTITINGTITGVNGGFAGGAAGAGGGANPGAAGSNGMNQPGGGGGDSGIGTAGGVGGSVLQGGLLYASGGAAGTTGTQITGSGVQLVYPPTLMGSPGGGGGAGAGAGAGGAGGRGGGAIMLIAPTILLGAASVFITSGTGGSAPAHSDAGGGGGGAAGNVYMYCRSFTDNGATFTQTGGAGAASGGAGQTGGNGAAGTRQILIYA